MRKRTSYIELKLALVTACAAAAMLLSNAALAQDNTKTIGVSIPAATHGWTGAVNYFAQQAEKRLESQYENIEIVVVTAGGPGEQANDVRDLVTIRNIDALVILPFASAPLTGPVKRVAEKGIFITVVDRGLTEKGISDLYVAGNNFAFGNTAGEYFAKRLEAGDNIVILRGIPTVIDNQRVKGFMSVIEDTGINVLAKEYANWSRSDAFKVMQDFLLRFDDIDAVWASDDDMALGVIEAVKQAERADELFIVGGAGMSRMVKRVMEGNRLTPVDVLYPPAMIATAMNLTVLQYVSKAPVLGEFILDTPLITEENAEKYYYPDSPY